MPSENERKIERRHESRRKTDLTEFRLEKLEEIVERIVESQETLVRMEQQNLENGRLILAIRDRQDYHGKVLDRMTLEVQECQTHISSIQKKVVVDPVDYATTKQSVGNHSRLFNVLSAGFILGAIAIIFKVIQISPLS